MTDEQLMTDFYNGGISALGEIYRRHAPGLTAWAERRHRRVTGRSDHQAQDGVQAVFLKLLAGQGREAARFNPAKGRLLAWLRQVLKNVLRDLQRRRGYRTEISSSQLRLATTGDGPPAWERDRRTPAPDAGLLADELASRVHDSLNELSDRQATVIRSRYLLGESQVQIAKSLGVSNALVSAEKTAAVRRLRTSLADAP